MEANVESNHGDVGEGVIIIDDVASKSPSKVAVLEEVTISNDAFKAVTEEGTMLVDAPKAKDAPKAPRTSGRVRGEA
jgi:hypothetical protein